MTDTEKYTWFLHGIRASTIKCNGESMSETFYNKVFEEDFKAQLDASNAFPLDAAAKSLLHVIEEPDRAKALEVNEKRLAELREKGHEQNT